MARDWQARPGEVMPRHRAQQLRRIAEGAAGDHLPADGHACPECPLGAPAPFCSVCLGAGLVDDARLGRWQREQNQAIAEGKR